MMMQMIFECLHRFLRPLHQGDIIKLCDMMYHKYRAGIIKLQSKRHRLTILYCKYRFSIYVKLNIYVYHNGNEQT